MKSYSGLMASRKKRIIFFYHLPKTAGTTFRKLLEANFCSSDICPAHNWTEFLNLNQNVKNSYRLYEGHFYNELGIIAEHKPYTFTLLRNPIERALSHYGHVLRDPKHYLHRRAVELGSLDAYMKDPVTRLTISNFQTRLLAYKQDPRKIFHTLSESQRKSWKLEEVLETSELDISDDRVLADAQSRLSGFDLVGLTERFEESVGILYYQLGWSYPESIFNENVNSSRPQSTQISENSLRSLVELNQLDLELYRCAETSFRKSMSVLLYNLLKQHNWGLLPKIFKGSRE